MYFLPYHRTCIETDLEPASCISKLEDVTEPYRLFRLRHSKPFAGEVTSNGFKIRRILVYYNNSYSPVIQGTFLQKSTIQPVKLLFTFRLAKGAVFFLVVWYSALFSMLLFAPFMQTNLDNFTNVIFLTLLLGPWLVSIPAFSFEVYRNKKFLLELLQARECSF